MQTDSLQALAVTVAQVHSVQEVLKLVVDGLAEQPDIALARIWLAAPGGEFRLAAGAGTPLDKKADWSRLGGEFSRFRAGEKKVGHIGATGESILLRDVAKDHKWLARPDWAKREKIVSFAGHPLTFRDEVLGVLAVFSRGQLGAQDFKWLRIFADSAAVAIANARAFEEIDRLRQQLEQENDYLRAEVEAAGEFGDIVGRSPALQKVLRQGELVAQSDAAVLIQGETGTGKDLVAHAVHERSPRRGRPLIRVNCGSIPAELLESEFFGHVKGAFTGAVRDRAGRFQLADGGTLFLDEVGEIPLALQSKLLRVLQEGEFERVGEERTRRADVRIIAATNRDLRQEAERGRFRQDLYYRLSVFPVEVPPLRERKEDIPLLAAHFVARSCRRLNCDDVRLTRANIEQLQAYDWPGNIRELQNVIERAVILSQGRKLSFDLPAAGAGGGRASVTAANQSARAGERVFTADELRRLERDNIVRALEETGHKVYGPGGAAELLQMRPTTLMSRIKALGIQRQT